MFKKKKSTLSLDDGGNKEEGEYPVARPQQGAAAMPLDIWSLETELG